MAKSFKFRFYKLSHSAVGGRRYQKIFVSLLVAAGLALSFMLLFGALSTLFVLLASTLLAIQGAFTLMWMLYAWEDPAAAESHKSPSAFVPPLVSFTALVPARHEEKVIADTIIALSRTRYPDYLKEILVLCRIDDTQTIAKVNQVITRLQKENIKLVTFGGLPINKPFALNVGLSQASKKFIAVFDAEDEPHRDIFQIANTLICRRQTDVVQSGVQLINLRSRWFSALNCLEYFFWFKSGLHFFTRVGQVTPLAGNTVFIRKSALKKVGGWDDRCLTEDADIGLRLAAAGAKARVVYDELHVTREETPATVDEFIRQRTRWNQGFLQVLAKGDWRALPQLRQKLVSLYVLLSPIFQLLTLIFIPVSFYISFVAKIPLIIALFSFVPSLLLLLHISILAVGLVEFAKVYRQQLSILLFIQVIFAFFPYQLLLSFSSLRALSRYILNLNGWEKTLHFNAHRLAFRTLYAK